MKIISTLAVMASMFMFISFFEDQLQIVPRFRAGTIQKDVERVQTYTATDALGVMIRKLDAIRFAKNMSAIRQHVQCVENEASCGGAWQPN